MSEVSLNGLIRTLPGGNLFIRAGRIGDDMTALVERMFRSGELKIPYADKRFDVNPIFIPGSVLFYWNPAANKEKASRLAARLSSSMGKMTASGNLTVGGEYSFHSTLEDTERRIDHIVERAGRLLEENPHQRIAVVAFGGDRTADDIAYAVARIRSEYSKGGVAPNAVAVAYPGGTANDVRAVTGSPPALRRGKDSSLEFLRHLSMGSVAELPLVQFDLKLSDKRRMRWHSIYGFTAPNSGTFFRELEAIKRRRKLCGESVTVAGDYLPKLPRTVWEAREPAYIRVAMNGEPMNEGRPFKIGEIFLTIPGQFGNVTKLPVPEMGARAYIAYPFPWGLMPFFEPFGRKVLVDLGFQHFVNLGGRVLPMTMDRQLDLLAGDVMGVDFQNRDGSPREVFGTLAGDAVGPLTGFEARIAGRVPFLCHPRSDLMVLQGRAKPLLPSFLRSGISFMKGALHRWV
jgi:hypothetical protein